MDNVGDARGHLERMLRAPFRANAKVTRDNLGQRDWLEFDAESQDFPKNRSTSARASSPTCADVVLEWSGRWESNISPSRGYCHQVNRLRAKWRAACDLRAKNTVIPDNASQCGRSWIALAFAGSRIFRYRSVATVSLPSALALRSSLWLQDSSGPERHAAAGMIISEDDF